MRSSTKKSSNASTGVKNRHVYDSAVGLCKNCGHRISLCGRQFTADIECCKCNYINEFRNSQQPISVRSQDCSVANVNH
jgi:hypothetical protein